MRLRARTRPSLVPVLAGWAASVVLVTRAAAAPPAAATPLDRPIDPVTVEGAALPELLGKPIGSLRIAVWRDGTFQPIPFQIDERDATGGWVFPAGPEASHDEDDGHFDANDVLSLMASDLAEAKPADATAWAFAGASPAVVRELRFRDPLDGRMAFAYASAWDGAAPPPSDVDYVRYDPATDEVHARTFILGFNPEIPFAIDRMRMRLPDGSWSPSRVDILKTRLRSTIWSVYDFDRNQDDFEAVTAAWIDGPVRVVLHKGISVRMILGIQTPKVWNDTIFHPYSFAYQVEIAMPFTIPSIFSRFELSSGVDFDGLNGAKLYVKGVAGPVAVVGQPAGEALARLAASGAEARVTALDWNGRFSVTRIQIDPSVPLRVKLRWVDDPQLEDPPERVRGATPGLYFDFENWLAVEQKNVSIGTGIYLPPTFRPGDEDAFERQLDHPVTLAPAT